MDEPEVVSRARLRRTTRPRLSLPAMASWALIGPIVIGMALPARAQTPSPLPEWQYSSGISLQQMFQPDRPPWQVELGVGAAFQPQYDGAQRYQVLPGPSIDIRYRDLAFLSTGEGLGVNLLTGANYRAGVAISYDLGRRVATNYSQLNGLGNINPAPEVKVFGEYALSKSFPLVIRVDVRRALGGTDGLIGDIGAYLPMPGSSPKFVWFAGPTMTVADATYMNAYFGIGQAQAYHSGYALYHANAGIKSAGFGVAGTWFMTQHWLFSADGAITQLVGSTVNSPITEAATEGVVSLAITYKF